MKKRAFITTLLLLAGCAHYPASTFHARDYQFRKNTLYYTPCLAAIPFAGLMTGRAFAARGTAFHSGGACGTRGSAIAIQPPPIAL